MPYVERVGSRVAGTMVPVAEIGSSMGFTDAQVRLYERFLGLRNIAVARDEELGDLLLGAAREALRGVEPKSVRHVVHAYTLQFTPPPRRHLLGEIQELLDLGHASSFGLTHQNCVAGLYALKVARLLLRDEPAGAKVLVLTGDKVLSSLVRVLPDTTIMGEAASAFVVGNDPRGDRVAGSAIQVAGRFYRCLDLSEELRLEYKRFYPQALEGVMRDAMRNAGIKGEDIAAIVPHNVNRMSWKGIARNLGIEGDRVYLDNVPKYGHCFASDPFLNLQSARREGRIGPGDTVLMVGAGLGASFAATVLETGEGVPE
ncbi:3-oxoacyl-[acyl-carrier-protein] synthase III C-terminal domain-containing protein [Streptomyces sp. Tue 6075]|uniref:3-oxoacyl-ACP synthase III family protein n=1 Tax=Streptomyces sp. Tue 6075 TaxID=1661694 RepID=UPI000A98484A|nr:3-oxoacyl-[acyl-carrier-protein] synthase III C-terminal domain-containing protein [Streptomyces sp. Tue 6075]